MAAMGEDIRERTDALDAAGNTTAAIGKGFAIGSAALVSLALFGAYVVQADITVRDSSILDPEVCTSQSMYSVLIGSVVFACLWLCVCSAKHLPFACQQSCLFICEPMWAVS